MKDFAAPYRQKVVHFGIWADEGEELIKGDRDAWNILTDAARRTTTEDMRESQNVSDALEWFEGRLARPRPVHDFRNALNINDPMHRYWAIVEALKKLKKFMSA